MTTMTTRLSNAIQLDICQIAWIFPLMQFPSTHKKENNNNSSSSRKMLCENGKNKNNNNNNAAVNGNHYCVTLMSMDNVRVAAAD
ncbi:hypothetical protein ACLKA7_007331 [Drosophila subpalustris]